MRRAFQLYRAIGAVGHGARLTRTLIREALDLPNTNAPRRVTAPIANLSIFRRH